MKQTLEDLWYSYLQEIHIKWDKEMREASEELDKVEDILRAKLSEEQNKQLDEYENGLCHVDALAEKEAFIKGVRFAAKFLIEALCEN